MSVWKCRPSFSFYIKNWSGVPLCTVSSALYVIVFPQYASSLSLLKQYDDINCVIILYNLFLSSVHFQKELLCFQKQARKAYEILRLNSTNQADKAQYQSYRLDVKKRLNVPFQVRGPTFFLRSVYLSCFNFLPLLVKCTAKLFCSKLW